MDTKFGFDSKFFSIFEKHVSSKNELQKHGIILFDKMSVRESLNVCSTSLTYKGLIEFGNDEHNFPKASTIEDKANMPLVFMFQPLCDNYTQPVAVFASKGPVHGTVLAQLLLKFIILVEKAGVKVHGLVCDGATTNGKLWSELGTNRKINELNNSFIHPLGTTRNVFSFSDTPHLIKNIRNRLNNKKKLKVFIIFY